MTISIITVCYNAAATIRHAVDSVLAQKGVDLQYIVVDGASTDGTTDILREYGNRISVLISEPDKGLYDAMNKGLKQATGDVIGILNADDFYAHDEVLAHVAQQMAAETSDACFADLVYVAEPDLGKVVRFYPGKGFQPRKMLSGNMPPHPTFFVSRKFYEEYGGFDTSFRISADFELMVRYFLVAKGTWTYLPEVIVKMRTGGSSTSGLSSTLTINREMLRACRMHGFRTSLLRIYSKYFKKIFQLVSRPA